MSLAYSHGVFPLVYNVLKKYDDLIAFDKLSYMRQTYMDIVKQNMLMTSELLKIVQLLEENNIATIAFKGPTLSKSAYGDITLRQYVDLDILIDKKNIEQAYQILLSKEYSTSIEYSYLNNDLYIEKNSDIQFFKKNILLELHWKLFKNQFTQKTKNINMFDNIKNISIKDYDIKIFSDEILLVYLCMHGSKHLWERIEWIIDIDKLITNAKYLDWNKIKKFSKKFDSEIMLELGLYLSSKYFGTQIPKERLNIRNNNLMNKLEKYTLKEWQFNLEGNETKNNYKKFIYHFNLKDTMLIKMSFVFQTFFPLTNGDISVISLPKYLYFTYYIIKPFRLLIKYISKLF